MTDELTVVEAEVLTPEEKMELSTDIDRIITEHKHNRQEINRLVFQSVAAMTEADDVQGELENKGFFRRFIGSITGSNQKLQNKINHNRAVAQYAAQQTLQKLAEQNLMTFDLITAVNNKLNASLYAVNEEFSKIYTGLEKFFKHNRNEMVRLETRLAKVEQNVQLLTWQNSIEYLEFDGEEYLDMDDTKKIVCLVRDFYDITQGKWSTSDLLLLKTAMATIGIQPKSKVNYFRVLREIENNTALKNKLLNGMEIRPITEPEYLIAMSTLKKMDSLHNEESYMVNTLESYMKHYGVEIEHEKICDDLTDQYLQEHASVNINIDVESYDMILDLLYNLQQAKEEKLLSVSSQDFRMHEAEQAYLQCRFQEAFESFRFLAEHGIGRAMYFMGIFYRNGYGKVVDIDEETGNAWTKKGMEVGYPLCTWHAADILLLDDEKKKNMMNSVLKDVIRLAENGDPFAQCMLGCEENNAEEAMKWMKKSAMQGYRIAQYNLGNWYTNGFGVEQNCEEAVRWYQKAAEQGYAIAQCVLGEMYEYGNGTLQDYGEAVKWYRKAAEQGLASGQCNLAGMYGNGLGVMQDYEEAVKWYRKAAEQGDARAQCNLGVMYRNGLGVTEDYEEAVKWYRKAAEQGNARAQSKLGYMYHYGKGITQDYEEAVKWYRKAAEQGLAEGQGNLGYMYHNGSGVVQDYEEAVKWYRKAADQEDAWSQCQLGYMYEYGYGVSENRNKAIEWYRKAAQQGNTSAQNALQQLGAL